VVDGASALRSQRALLPYYAFRTGQALTAIVPRRAAHAVARLVADGALRTRPHRFDGLRSNLRHVLPDASDRELELLVRRNVRGIACGWSDVLQLTSHRRQMARRLDTVHTDVLEHALARGHGAVVVSLHLGSWEAGLAAWSFSGHQMSVLAERIRPQRLFDVLVSGRSGLGLEVVTIDTRSMRTADPAAARRLGASAMRNVVRVLRANGTIAIAIDRDLIGNGVPAEFFGAQALIPDGVVDVAIRTGAALVPTFLINLGTRVCGEMHDEIAYDPDAPREPEVRRVTAELLRVCEDVIRRHPDQWHVLDPIWTDPPDGARRGAAS